MTSSSRTASKVDASIRGVRHRAARHGRRDANTLSPTVDTDRPPSYSWFRSRGGRRFGIECAAIVVLKLVALTLLWFFCIRPQPRADTAPAAIADHLAAPAREVSDDR